MTQATRMTRKARQPRRPKCGLLDVSLVQLLVLCLFVASTVCAAEDVSSPTSSQNCAFDAATDTLTCTMSTLNANNNTSAIPSATRSARIRIRCLGDDDDGAGASRESVLRINHFGYLTHLRSLSVDHCKLRRVPGLAFSGLANLRDLRLASAATTVPGSSPMELDMDALTGLDHLRTMNLTQNNLWSLPTALFCSLSSLHSLNLSGNFLHDVSELGFASTQLQPCKLPVHSLDLSHNRYSRLAPKAFGQLRKLQHLNLAHNNLNVVDDLALHGLDSLASLNLASNQLVALPPRIFSAAAAEDGEEASACCSYLQELRLENNSLSGLAPGLFGGLQHLLVLNLSRNDIGNDWLTPKTFSSLMRLLALDLSHNRLTRLDQSLLSPLTSLQLLDLSHNQLHTVHGNTFLSQYNLHILRLSHNRIDSLKEQALTGLSVLGELALDHNGLEHLRDDVFKNCTSLVDLSMHHNHLKSVPTLALAPLAKVKTLDLGDNGIANLSNQSLLGLQSVHALRLASNGIRELGPGVFEGVPNVQMLNLASNRLGQLPQNVFGPLRQLRMLRLDDNDLEDINGILAGQTELRWLNVSSNRLLWFDYAFIPKNLEWLDLHANQIEDLGNYYKLDAGFSLRTLLASANRIKKLEQLSLPSSLESVFLAENRIRVVAPGTFQDKSNLSRVDLTSNLIRQLQLPALAIRMESDQAPLPEFLLGNNPFICDCEMEWLQKVNQMTDHRQYPLVMDLDQIRCRLNNQHPNSSSALSTTPIMEVHPDQFLCQYRAHCFALCLCCEFFACDCRMQCPEGCSCFHDSTWSSNVIQCSVRGHTDIPPLIPMDATSVCLDGNNFSGTLESQAFIGRKRVKALFLNSSQIGAISNQTFNGLTELEVLHLEDNKIQRLEGYEFGNLTSLVQLHLQNNRLMHISKIAFSSLISLEYLNLQGNHLSAYPVWDLRTLPALSQVLLSNNDWSCQCDFVQKFQEFSQSNLVDDFHAVQCFSPDGISVNLSDNITCSDAMAVTFHQTGGIFSINVILLLVIIFAICIVIISSSLMVFIFRTPLRVWLHSKYGIRVLDSYGTSAHDKLYDALISYSLKDEDFVQQILIPKMELEEPSHYKLCLQHRDLPSNSSIVDSFPGVSQLCAKHVLVVSRAYLSSEWIQMKFALQQNYSAKKLRPVIVLLEELSTLDLAAAPEFNLLLKSGPVVRWNEAGFWNKLRFYLPDARLRGYKRNINSAPNGLGGLGSMEGRRTNIALHTASPKATSLQNNGGNFHLKYSSPVAGATSSSSSSAPGWHFDGLLPSSSNNNSSSSASTSTTAGGSGGLIGGGGGGSGGTGSDGSPRTFSGDSTSSSNHSSSHPASGAGANVLSNPLEQIQWPEQQQQHTYQTISDLHGEQQQQQQQQPAHHIYHTLEPSASADPDDDFAALGGGGGGRRPQQQQQFDTLGKLDVMLPNGQFVPATLVRNNLSGKVTPLVQIMDDGDVGGAGAGAGAATLPTQQQQQQQLDQSDVIQVSFPTASSGGRQARTSGRQRTSRGQSSSNNKRHFV